MFAKGNLLVPTDFSHYSIYALIYALALAKKYRATVHLVHILDAALFSSGSGHGRWLEKDDASALCAAMQEHAESRFVSILQKAADQGVQAVPHIVVGSPAKEINHAAQQHNCGLIVIATHGRTGFDHVVFGSVSEKVVRQASVPVLSIKHPEREFVHEPDSTIHLRRILYPSDFSEFSARGLPYAASLCREFGATLVMLHVAEIPVVLPEFLPDSVSTLDANMEKHARETLDRMGEGLEGVNVEAQVQTGVPYREILRVVHEHEIDLVVMPTHGRSGIAHVVFGSVSEKVVRSAPCPVLTVRPPAHATVAL